MAIEGPLRELGIHDVFQLLDLSRKTGTLRVTSDLRDDEGVVTFEAGRVVQATIRSNPVTTDELLQRSGRVGEEDVERAREYRAAHPWVRSVGEALVQTGAITRRELERQLRMQIESVVFELMSWREGFFSFEERASDAPLETPEIRVSTESLLMEGARRIDEWSRIADKIPSLAVVPVLAPVDDAHPTQLDLLPHEWEALTLIDGTRDLRAIANGLGRAEFEVAKIAYGLATTGIVEIRQAERRPSMMQRVVDEADERVQEAREALRRGDAERALTAAIAARTIDPARTEARLLAARALTRLGRHGDALEELRRALRADPLTPEVHRALGFAAARAGDLVEAIARWEHYQGGSGAADATVRRGLELARDMTALLEAQARE